MAGQTQKRGPKGTWGGARPGAGRPTTSPFVPHLERPRLKSRRAPVKLLVRVRSGFPSLRSEIFYESFERAALKARALGLRIIEFAITERALHLLCEFHTNEQLEHSLKSLNTTLAIALKKIYRKTQGTAHTGPVFLGRFQMELLEDPTRVKHALREIFSLNPSEEITARKSTALASTPPRTFRVDPYSSAPLFTAWRKLWNERGDPALPSDLAQEKVDSPTLERIRRLTALPQFHLTRTAWRQARIFS